LEILFLVDNPCKKKNAFAYSSLLCPAGQSMVGASCQADCTLPTGSAQNFIVELRSARLRKSDVCTQNPTGRDCQEAEGRYDLMLNEYRTFLGGVPMECRTAPDPIAI
jgi:hypothetical protein